MRGSKERNNVHKHRDIKCLQKDDASQKPKLRVTLTLGERIKKKGIPALAMIASRGKKDRLCMPQSLTTYWVASLRWSLLLEGTFISGMELPCMPMVGLPRSEHHL